MNGVKQMIPWLVLIITLNLNGQDTISVFFESGKFKLNEKQLATLNIIADYEVISDLDSVCILGMADSIGDFKANMKLSWKRASTVAKHLEKSIPENVHKKIVAMGETTIHERDQNRRVDIILYKQPMHQPEDDPADSSHITIDTCYSIDYELLHRCNIRTIIKARKELVVIETSLSEVRQKNIHYFGSTSTNGDFVAKRLRWRTQRTGRLWWAETRNIATIPKEAFDKFKIFKIAGLPCDTCNEAFQSIRETSREDTCIQVDLFLMNNIQIKTRLFNNKWVRIRAPKEYVNITDKYYIACDFSSELVWKTISGSRKRHYYYAALPRRLNYLSNITRVMDCCENNRIPSQCNMPLIFIKELLGPDESLMLIAEAGSQYCHTKLIPYVGIGISKEGLYSRIRIIAGSDKSQNFFSSIGYQIHFLSFPFSMINPFPTWQSATKQPLIYRYGRVYLGTEVMSRVHKAKPGQLSHCIHIGLAAVDVSRDVIINRVFIHYGLNIDYLGRLTPMVLPMTTIGISIKLARLN